MNTERVWILGATDPEMEAIERLLVQCGESVVYALDADGRRVRPADAYRVTRLSVPLQGCTATIYRVECDGPAIPSSAIVIDHHRPGDPGYGRGPEDYWCASSIGQVVNVLGVEPTAEMRIIAAADHCLTAAYAGKCDGVERQELFRWRVLSRSRWLERPPEQIRTEIDRARLELIYAMYGGYCPDCNGTGVVSEWECASCAGLGWIPSRRVMLAPDVYAADMRGRHIAEMPEASAIEGICYVADGLPGRDGRIKVICQSGTPEQIRAFMDVWAPNNGLVDVYGDPSRGIAGGYLC